MIFENFENIRNKDYPVIIFGSGPAGVSLALGLEKKNINSLIIEAGTNNYSEDSQQNYKSKIIGDEINDLKYSRLRQFGGTSGHWGGWCRPIERWNIQNWDLKPNELEKYSKHACKILEINHDFKNSKISEYFNQIKFQYSNVRYAEKFGEHVKKSKLIDLCLNTQVVNFNGHNGVFKQAEIISDKKIFFVKSKFFVLACGGIENSRILLWTRINNRSLIDENLPIGKYWMTHPWFLGGVGFLKKKKLKDILKNDFLEYSGPIHIATSKKIVNDYKILSGALYMNADEDNKIYKEIIKDFLCISPVYGKKIARMVFNKDLKCGNIFMSMEEAANENNKIDLDKNDTDTNNVPITNLYYKKSKETLTSAKKILEELAYLFANSDIGRIGIMEKIENLESYESLGAYHHMGGTRIGIDPKTSVVNSQLKLHSSKNFYITGSSVFTTSGYANPTYTIVKLSLRLADEIEKNLN